MNNPNMSVPRPVSSSSIIIDRARIIDEIDLQYRILDWVHLCVDNSRFNIEIPHITETNSVRRIDFIQNNPRNVIAYELKKDVVTMSDITTIIGERSYLELLYRHYKPRSIKFVFLAMQPANDKVLRLLDAMPAVGFMRVQDLMRQTYFKASKRKWRDNLIQLNNTMLHERFRSLFDPDFINFVHQKAS